MESYQNQGFWSEKRPHDIMDGGFESDPFLNLNPNKRQALGDIPSASSALMFSESILGFEDPYFMNHSNNPLLFGNEGYSMEDHTKVVETEAETKRESSVIISFGGNEEEHCEIVSIPRKSNNTKMSAKNNNNNFPSNVRSLLSTGIMDGVPVKYIAWSREKQLPGVIKGAGYLCGCHSCNYSNVINAYEFERHANCKTKHPNNHIYFENGKTIYGAVQELKTTPQNLLLDAIQTVAGSPINQESFRLWKASFMAASRELKRIYGSNDEIKQSF